MRLIEKEIVLRQMLNYLNNFSLIFLISFSTSFGIRSDIFDKISSTSSNGNDGSRKIENNFSTFDLSLSRKYGSGYE